MNSIFRFSIPGLLILFLSVSCAFRQLVESLPKPAVVQNEQLPRTVAVLPFVNQTSNPHAGEMVRKMFYNFFSSLNYIDLELAVIDERLKRADMYQQIVSGQVVSAHILGQLLGVDGIIFGEVTRLGKLYALVYTDNQAGLRARMILCESGTVAWELEHTIHIEDGDVPLSPISLAATVIETAISYGKATHMNAASKLCMQMVSTIPNSPMQSDSPPQILALVHNGAGKLLSPGDYLKVVLVGKEDQTASWSLPPLVENQPMREKQPGVYIGAYRVQPWDRLPHGRIVGYLKSDSGPASQWVDTIGPVKMGQSTMLPQVISQDTILDGGKSPYRVKDALVVLPDATLTVNPGAIIWFDGLGIVVKGTIQLLGTAQEPIRLAGLATSWKGIFLDRSRTKNRLSFCEIVDAEFAIRASHSTVTIEHCLFQDNMWGIVVEDGMAEIYSSLIRTSEKSGIAARQAQLVVKASMITENKSGGFLLDTSSVEIEQNNIVNNGGWGIKLANDNTPVTAAHNWWGKETPNLLDIIGPVTIQPTLTKPIAFTTVD